MDSDEYDDDEDPRKTDLVTTDMMVFIRNFARSPLEILSLPKSIGY